MTDPLPCAQCGKVDPLFGTHPCSLCSFHFCIDCGLAHYLDGIARRLRHRRILCDDVAEAAALHAELRVEPEYTRFGVRVPPPGHTPPLTAEDWRVARKLYATSVHRGHPR